MKRLSVFAAIVSLCISLTQPPAHAAEQKFQAEGCHAKVSATLQIKDGSGWKDVIAAQGWELVASCAVTNPYEPWAMADLEIGSTIRWHISCQVLGIGIQVRVKFMKFLIPIVSRQLQRRPI